MQNIYSIGVGVSPDFQQKSGFFLNKRIYSKYLPDDKLKIDGVVIDTLPDTKFRVKLSDGREIFAYLSGKMRMNYIKVTVGDRVTIELSPDGDKGRITYRK